MTGSYVITACELVTRLDSVKLFIISGSVMVSITLYYTMNKLLILALGKSSYVRSPLMQPWVSSLNHC